MPPDQQLGEAARVLGTAERILIFTGAGISTESGIPDFRGPDGIWSKLDPGDFTIQRYLASAEVRMRRWEMHRSGELWGARSAAEPNRAHHAVTRLWESGRMIGCITQNIDGLHHAAGLPAEAIAEVHGNVKRTRCTACGREWPTEEVLAWVDDGMADPRCPACHSIVKPTTVLFGEMLPPAEIAKAESFAEGADAVIAVGSTMSVYPATDMALEPVRRSAPLIIVNLGPTDHDHTAAVRIDASAGDALPALVDVLLAN